MISTPRRQPGAHSGNLRRYVHFAHLWIGLILGAYFALMGLTGSTLVFKGEIHRALTPSLYRVAPPADGVRIPLDTLVADFTRRHPRITGFQLVPPATRTDSLMIRYIPADPVGWHGPVINPYSPVAPPLEQGRHDRRELFINPYTGAVLGEQLVGGTFFYVVHNLHAHLLLEGIGYGMHTCVSVILVVLVLSGLWLWLPTPKYFRKQLKARSTIKRGAGIQRLVVDLHNVAGFYMLAVLLLIVTTASLHFWPRPAAAIASTVAAIIDAGGRREPLTSPVTPPITGSLATKAAQRPAARPDFDQFEQQAKQAAPSLVPEEIDVDTDALTVLMGHADDHGVMPRLTTVAMDGTSGRVLSVTRPTAVPLQQRMIDWIMFVHFGQWAPGFAFYFVKGLWCVAGLSPALLFTTGLWMYLTRRKAKRRTGNRQLSPAR